MSHQPERKEKICLNCGAELVGRYCHVCGQENVEFHQGFWAMVKHFVFDVFHFDGRFLETLRHLVLKPGTISREYIRGKRTRYLDPIRMYLFTSAIFFLVFYAVRGSVVNVRELVLSRPEQMSLLAQLQNQLKARPRDTVLEKEARQVADPSNNIVLESGDKNVSPDSLVTYNGKTYKLLIFHRDLAKIPTRQKPNSWIWRRVNSRINALNERYSDNPGELARNLADNFIHKMPYLLFISLPFFAGILNLLYLKRKQLAFSDHAIFTLHHYIISFILMMLIFILKYVSDHTGWQFFSTIGTIVFILWPVYLFLEMKVFYGQGIMLTLLKLVTLSFLMIFVLTFLFTLFFLFSLFQI